MNKKREVTLEEKINRTIKPENVSEVDQYLGNIKKTVLGDAMDTLFHPKHKNDKKTDH